MKFYKYYLKKECIFTCNILKYSWKVQNRHISTKLSTIFLKVLNIHFFTKIFQNVEILMFQQLTKILRRYFNCNWRLEIFLTRLCNILCYVGTIYLKRATHFTKLHHIKSESKEKCQYVRTQIQVREKQEKLQPLQHESDNKIHQRTFQWLPRQQNSVLRLFTMTNVCPIFLPFK